MIRIFHFICIGTATTLWTTMVSVSRAQSGITFRTSFNHTWCAPGLKILVVMVDPVDHWSSSAPKNSSTPSSECRPAGLHPIVTTKIILKYLFVWTIRRFWNLFFQRPMKLWIKVSAKKRHLVFSKILSLFCSKFFFFHYLISNKSFRYYNLWSSIIFRHICI